VLHTLFISTNNKMLSYEADALSNRQDFVLSSRQVFVMEINLFTWSLILLFIEGKIN